MSTIALLMGLLVLTFVGALVLRGTRGLPSGAEFLGLGLVAGPHALGIVERASVAAVEPVLQVALAWLALVVGLDFGQGRGRGARLRPMLLGVLGALATAGVVFAVVLGAARTFGLGGLDPNARLLLASGMALASAETTRLAVRWVAERTLAEGPLARLLFEMASADDVVPLLGLGLAFALPVTDVPGVVQLPPVAWFGVTVGLGAVLGLVTALLLRHAEGSDIWGALFGVLLLAVGAASYLGLSTLLVAFVLGLALALASPARRAMRRLVVPTERPILLPVLVLAGARLDLGPLLETRSPLWLVVLALGARLVAKLAWGAIVAGAAPPARPAGPALGLAMLSAGPMTVSAGLVLALRFPGPVGDTVLATAVLAVLLGEVTGPFALRRALDRAGELARVSEAALDVSAPPPSVEEGAS